MCPRILGSLRDFAGLRRSGSISCLRSTVELDTGIAETAMSRYRLGDRQPRLLPMLVRLHTNAQDFASIAHPFLLREEAVNCIALGTIDALLTDPQRCSRSRLLSIEEEGSLSGIAWITPPYPLGLSRMPEQALRALVEYLPSLAEGVPGVVGPKVTVDEFIQQWVTNTGVSVKSCMDQAIHQLEQIAWFPTVPGRLRAACESDRELLVEWSHRFSIDCGLGDDRPGAVDAAAHALDTGSRVLWELEGTPVSMAGFVGRTPSGIRVSFVYTPPEHRGRGFASAVVAALTQQLLNEGRRFCFLYTDLANPTSNRIYHRIGYRVVCEAVHCKFG